MKKSFSKKNLIVMSLGNIVGSGIFLGSSTVISLAGPAAVLAYLAGGLMMTLEVTFITEMCVVNPAPGAFRVHASEIFGPWISFVNGWMFWCSGILGMASELVAAAIFTAYWLPAVPLWVFCVVYAVIMALINLKDLGGLSRMETALSFVKVAALVLFVVLGILSFLGVFNSHTAAGSNPFTSYGQFFPKGMRGLFACMVMVMFSFTGTGIIGLAIADTESPDRTAPSAIRTITATVTALYTLSILIIVLLVPWNTLSPSESPFVAILNQIRVPYSDHILNFIVLTASLSGLNSSMYSSSRMLSSLSADGQAPRLFQKTNKNGAPSVALGLSSAVLLLTAVLSYAIPNQIFVVLATSSGFLALFNWLTISVTHYFYRKKTLREHPEKLKYRAPGYPFTSFLLAILILAVFATSPLYPGQVSGLIGGLVLLAGLITVYFILRKCRVLR